MKTKTPCGPSGRRILPAAPYIGPRPRGFKGPGPREFDVAQTRARRHGAALVLVTHSQAAAARADRVLHLTAQGIRPGA